MSVNQLDDGRWVVRYRKGKWASKPNSSCRYFGRGDEARELACNFDKFLKSQMRPKNVRNKLVSLEGEISQLKKTINDLSAVMEKKVQEELFIALNILYKNDVVEISREVFAGCGYIDILTDSEIIEVKIDREWKSGIGQLIAYKDRFPGRSLRLHLFGKKHGKHIKPVNLATMKTIIKTAKSSGINVSHHDFGVYKKLSEKGLVIWSMIHAFDTSGSCIN